MKINKIEESPGYQIESLSRNMRRFSVQILKERKVDLTLEQISVLIILNEHGSRFQNELAEIMSKDNPTLTRILDILEKKSLLKREVSQDDRRKFLIVLTANGNSKLKEVKAIVKFIRTTLFQNLTEEHMDLLLNLKSTIEGNISEYQKSK